MSDVRVLREKCDHERYDQHVIDPQVRHSFGNLCPGGREVWLRPAMPVDIIDLHSGLDFMDDVVKGVWVEVPGEPPV